MVFNSRFIVIVIVILILTEEVLNQVTKVDRDYRKILSRRKRHLTFPTGSIFIFTASSLKSIMLTIPKGWNVIVEMDWILKLPSLNELREAQYNLKVHGDRQRREILSNLEELFHFFGFDGETCVQKTMCEVKEMATRNEKTLIEELFMVIFLMENADETSNKYFNDCNGELYKNCNMSLLNFFLQ